jgi:DNA repair ATPase RecN
MDYFNPITGSFIQTTAAEHQQTLAKGQQLRRLQQLARNIAQHDDQAQYQVESTEETPPAKQDERTGEQRRRKGRHADSPEDQADDAIDHGGLDLTA